MKFLKITIHENHGQGAVTAMIEQTTEEKLRIFCVKHRKNMSEVTKAEYQVGYKRVDGYEIGWFA